MTNKQFIEKDIRMGANYNSDELILIKSALVKTENFGFLNKSFNDYEEVGQFYDQILGNDDVFQSL